MTQLTFHLLGTGGGRFVMITQRRRTAGLRLVHGETHVHIDPGPGALVFSNWARLSPQRLDAVVVTHCHPDHYADAEIFIEAMTHGTTRNRGILATTRSVLSGVDNIGPSISTYHQGLVKDVEILSPGHAFEVGSLGFKAVEARHSDPDTVGIKIETSDLGTIGYTSDTGYFPELGDIYKGVRLLFACTMWPRGQHLHMHLSTDEVLKIVERSSPEAVILTHFGMRMLNADPEAEASYLEESTGVPTIAARDGTQVVLGENIELRGPRKKDKSKVIEA